MMFSSSGDPFGTIALVIAAVILVAAWVILAGSRFGLVVGALLFLVHWRRLRRREEALASRATAPAA